MSVLDLSYRNLKFLTVRSLDQIEHLILDGNDFSEQSLQLPYLPRLHTLSLNRNQLQDTRGFLCHLSHYCPNLRHLSLIGNPGWPHPLTSVDAELYDDLRLCASLYLSKLVFLDSTELVRTTPTVTHVDDSRNAFYQRVKQRYTGKDSQGNRFISNHHL